MNAKMCCSEPIDLLTYLGYDPDDQGSNQTLLDALEDQAFAPARAYNHSSGWTRGTLGRGVAGTGVLGDADVAVVWVGRDGCIAVPEDVRAATKHSPRACHVPPLVRAMAHRPPH